MTNTRKCSHATCESSHLARGLCSKHYQQWKFGKLEAEALLTYDLHGLYESSTYNSWRAMKSRCVRPRDISFSKYGASGIAVCDRWFESFINFLEDMGERPEGMTLDRIDPAGNYEPSNCRWATPSQQTHNQRLRSDNKSGYKGVFYRKDKQKWSAYINVDKSQKRKYLGHFDTFEGAVKARKAAEVLYAV